MLNLACQLTVTIGDYLSDVLSHFFVLLSNNATATYTFVNISLCFSFIVKQTFFQLVGESFSQEKLLLSVETAKHNPSIPHCFQCNVAKTDNVSFLKKSGKSRILINIICVFCNQTETGLVALLTVGQC